MKKKAIILAMIMTLTLTACGGGGVKEEGIEETNAVAQTDKKEVAIEETEAPTEAVSVEFRNALRSAESYSDMMNMSKQGIYEQLISEYGDKFPEDAAQYAVDNLDVDFKENALKSAKTYQETMSMSTQAIYDQLISEYGEQFTPEEAQYAVDNLN